MSKLEKYLPFILATVAPLVGTFNYSSFLANVNYDQLITNYIQSAIALLIVWYVNKWLITLRSARMSRWMILVFGNLIFITCLAYVGTIYAPPGLSDLKNFWVILVRMSLLVVIYNVVLRVFESQKEQTKLQVQNLALQSENLKFQVETLKQQINPHFLFNSLNTLLDLIEDNQEEAALFTRKFSNLYRVVLQSLNYDYVPLDDELKFLSDYWGLLKMRFREAIELDIQIPEEKRAAEIPPLSLQFLVENAVKHNEASLRNPLRISVTESSNYLIVSNKVNPKRFPVQSERVGLENLQKRFTLLFKPIEFGQLGEEFVIKLPLKKL